MAFVDTVASFLRRSDTVRPTPKNLSPFSASHLMLVARPRDFSRSTGYHNVHAPATQLDDLPTHPPSYSTSSRERKPPCRISHDEESEVLPSYTLTVRLEGRVELKLEGITPFDTIENSEWHEVHVVLRGTMLSVHAGKSEPSPRTGLPALHSRGRLLRKYTMQHAEVGLASDHPKVILVPKPIAQSIPETSLDFLRATEPHLFDAQRQYVVRLRVEGHQLLLRVASGEEREAWLNALCLSIDIAAPLEERAEPRYQTLPRRRRVHRGDPQIAATLEEQQEICRQQFPHLLNNESDRSTETGSAPLQGAQVSATPAGSQASVTGDHSANPTYTFECRTESQNAGPGGLLEFEQPDIEVHELAIPHELDTSFSLPGLEQALERRLNYLNNLFQNVNRLFDQSLATSGSQTSPILDFPPTVDSDQKWDPSISVDPTREARYRRRCMPSLFFNSLYASKFVIRDGVRVEIDWEARQFKSIDSEPPSYQQAQLTEDSFPTLVSAQLIRRSTASSKNVGGRGLSSTSKSIPAHLQSTTLPIPPFVEKSGVVNAPVSDQVPLLSAWKELKGWTQSVRAMAIREDVRPTSLMKRFSVIP